jgi:hypothetical protein
MTAPALRSRVIFWRPDADQRERSGRRHHAILGRDVVFDDDGNAVQRTARAARLAFGVELVGDRQRVRIRLQDGADRGPLAVEGGDSRQIFFSERPRGVLPGLHPVLQFDDRRFVEIEGARLLSRRQKRRAERKNKSATTEDTEANGGHGKMILSKP